MPGLTQVDKNQLKGYLKKYPFKVAYGEVVLWPLEGAPDVAGDAETEIITTYETGAEELSEGVVKNNVIVTIRSRNVEAAMALMETVKLNDDLLDSTRQKQLTFVPITEEAGEKSVIFPLASLQAGLNFTPGENRQPTMVELSFKCVPDDTGIPFRYATN